MRKRSVIAVLMAGIVVLTGCMSASGQEGYGDAQPLVEEAVVDLAERTGVDAEEIAVQSVEETEFPDASLGEPEPGKMYAQVVTPGYIIRLSVEGETYTYHAAGERVVLASAQEKEGYGQAQPLVDEAIADLAARTGVDAEGIAVQSVEETEFPDASLGVPETGEMYAQVVTPGYIIRLSVKGETYTYHAGGGRVVLASPRKGEARGDLQIVRVRVAREEGEMTVRGETSLPDGACIQTELLVDDEAASWWPDTACAEVEDGEWKMEASLPPAGLAGTPQAMYVVRATAEGYPELEAARFPFDLYGPPCE
ncbi:MAG: hypothetical protein R6V13_13840 [Anaerolineae bacterium]